MRKVDDLVKAMSMDGISKSQVSALCKDIDQRVASFLNRPIAGDRPYVWPNALAPMPKGQHQTVAAAIRSVLAQENQAEGSKAWRHVADQLRPRFPKLAALMDDAEADVIAFMASPKPIGRNCIQPIPSNASTQSCRVELPRAIGNR